MQEPAFYVVSIKNVSSVYTLFFFRSILTGNSIS